MQASSAAKGTTQKQDRGFWGWEKAVARSVAGESCLQSGPVAQQGQHLTPRSCVPAKGETGHAMLRAQHAPSQAGCWGGTESSARFLVEPRLSSSRRQRGGRGGTAEEPRRHVGAPRWGWSLHHTNQAQCLLSANPARGRRAAQEGAWPASRGKPQEGDDTGGAVL